MYTSDIFAQASYRMNYQAEIRNVNGNLVKKSSVGIRVSILKDSVNGLMVYQETCNPNPQTNANGLVNIKIGSGVVLSGIFDSIKWSNGSYFIKIETDTAGGTNYINKGVSQLLHTIDSLNPKNNFSYNYNDITNKPSLSAVATSGSFNDLTNKPTTLAGYGISDLPRIIAGNNLANGTGYTISGYVITFTTPFTTTPNATATLINMPFVGMPYIISIISLSTTSMTVGVYTWVNDGSEPSLQPKYGFNFSFIVVGN